MATPPANPNPIIPILLLPSQVKATQHTLPLLTQIQRVLNESYTATYCVHPELFGTSHTRMADPAQLADIIGPEGFTVVLAREVASGTGTDQKENETLKACEVLATASVKDFGAGDLETYAQWSKNLGGKQWARAKEEEENENRNGDETREESEVPIEKRTLAEQKLEQKLEVTAFGVSPDHQSGGLGARLLEEIRWLVASRIRLDISTLPKLSGVGISSSPSHIAPIEGISLTEVRSKKGESNKDDRDDTTPRLVLMAIRELGNEAYYQRRGFRTAWSGPVPVGMWDCRKECTMVYMEMDLDKVR